MDDSLATRASRLFLPERSNVDVLELLTDIARSAKALYALWHPLGFINLELGALNECIYRLHIWPQHERHPKTPDWPIHTHVYDLESFVIGGTITDRRYSVQILDDNGNWLFGVRYNQEGSVLEPLGVEVAAKLEKESTHSTFERYQVTRGVFHSSEVQREELVVTVAKLTNFVSKQPLVLGYTRSPTGSFPYKQDAVSSDLLDALFTTIADSVNLMR